MIINGTAHEIRFYSVQGLITHPQKRGAFLLTEEATVIRNVAAGQNLNAQKKEGRPTIVENIPATINSGIYSHVDPVPGGSDDIVIVSQLFRAACTE